MTHDEKALTFVSWYIRVAVYLGDKLVYFGAAHGSYDLLQSLGYSCTHLAEIDATSIPKEYDRDRNGWWAPPKSLTTLKAQMAAVEARLRAERIAQLEQELERLRAVERR